MNPTIIGLLLLACSLAGNALLWSAYSLERERAAIRGDALAECAASSTAANDTANANAAEVERLAGSLASCHAAHAAAELRAAEAADERDRSVDTLTRRLADLRRTNAREAANDPSCAQSRAVLLCPADADELRDAAAAAAAAE